MLGLKILIRIMDWLGYDYHVTARAAWIADGRDYSIPLATFVARVPMKLPAGD